MAQYSNWTWDDYNLYQAVKGDMLDDIAYQAYGDSDMVSLLLYANPELARVIVFEGGELVRIPIVDERASSALPPWRQ